MFSELFGPDYKITAVLGLMLAGKAKVPAALILSFEADSDLGPACTFEPDTSRIRALFDCLETSLCHQ